MEKIIVLGVVFVCVLGIMYYISINTFLKNDKSKKHLH